VFFQRSYYRQTLFRQGVTDMMAVAPGIAAWGLMTGVTMVKAGLGTTEALLMSVLVFAGSAQLSAIPLLAANAPMWVILATAFCVNLRFVVFSAHMRPYVMHLPLRERLVMGYLCGDLSYVMFVKRFPKHDVDPDERLGQIAYLAGNTGLNWAAWVGASVLGVALANFIPTRWGLGFAGILALTGLLCSLASSRLRAISAMVAGAAAVASFALPLRLNILAAIAAAVVMCLLLEKSPLAHPRSAT
jgi:predicted branched-subunit amino acid permease